ncbi:MAG: hypothetical protein R3B90_19220 [Planctomycetaceae bacterium]
MSRYIIPIAAMLLLSASSASRGGWLCGDGGCKPAGCGCEVRWVCSPSWDKEKIEKTCFDIEYEHICVPRVKLPWQGCCTPRCEGGLRP